MLLLGCVCVYVYVFYGVYGLAMPLTSNTCSMHDMGTVQSHAHNALCELEVHFQSYASSMQLLKNHMHIHGHILQYTQS